ncbi:MAG: PQQ-binding-like beta-propeller repeat protein [Nitriliruptorales bacterium]|nr:PQQ-binding-like beta-propeller repeat protein [Nitriliruptorales bacterium]
MLVIALVATGVITVGTAVSLSRSAPTSEPVAIDDEPSPTPTPRPTPTHAAPTPTPSPDVKGVSLLGAPWGSVPGLLQFRGNPTHTFYGLGPVPDTPEIAWRYPDAAMCSEEVVGTRTETIPPEEPDGGGSGGSDSGEAGSGDDSGTNSPKPGPTTREVPIIKKWCGTGWTGQPVVWERPDGVVEMIVGAFDGAIHFLDTATGQRTRPPFQTGQMIKGTVTLDPDGFPLLYSGSRDNYFRVIALDRDVPTELWRLGPHPNGIWNNDWDGNASIIDDVLYTGGEDSWFRAIRLNRSHRDDGLVTVDPEVLVEVPGFTNELITAVGDRNVSIESSVAIHQDRAYFVNSGGRVVGLDISRVDTGDAPVVFDYWVGDDADASVVIDGDGMLYVSVEYERKTDRATEVGQLVKLDPSSGGNPRLWGVAIPPRPGPPDDGGSWSTPALFGDLLYLTTHPGELLVVDRHTGEVVHREEIGYHEWSSPVVVEDPETGRATLVVALCEASGLRAYDLADPRSPTERWTLHVGGCVESTPAVWKGGIYVGSRDGYLYGIHD